MLKKVIQKLLNKETILYVVFGVITTVVNYAVYYLVSAAGVEYALANVIAWAAAVAVAFVTNKLFVFEQKSWKPQLAIKELGLFVAARLLSLLLEEGFLIATVELLGANHKIMKLVISVAVVIINYFLSKLIIFKKDKA